SRINLKTKHVLESIYLEGGVRFSDNALFNPNTYAQLLLRHVPSKNLDLEQAYSIFHRPGVNSTLTQHQYSINLTFSISNGWIMQIPMSIINYDYRSLKKYDKTYDTLLQYIDTLGITEYRFKGKFNNETNINIHPWAGIIQSGIKKRFRYVSLKNDVAVFIERKKINVKYTSADTSHVDEYYNNVWIGSKNYYFSSDTNYSNLNWYFQGQFVSDINYIVPYCRERLILGIKFFIPFTAKQIFITASPYFTINLWKKTWLHVSYLYKGGYYIADNNLNLTLNHFDVIHSRLLLNANVINTRWFTIYMIFVHENITDNFTQNRYNTYSVFTGLKFYLP
ncbi:MAG: hypothetical protein NZ522_01395, partial [Chitinophagales bacterium]|nr:hypothetical protein [Chitinophagales bacterium]